MASEADELRRGVELDALEAIRDASKLRRDALKLTEGWRVALPWRAFRAHIMYSKAAGLEDVARTLALSLYLSERAA